MRIGIDVRYLSHGLMGGVHTYMTHFVPALVDVAPEHQIYLYADTKRPFELRSLPERVVVRYLPWRNPLWSVYNDFFMWRQMAHDHLDVAHFPANYGWGPPGVRTVITLHDALNVHPMPQVIRGLGDSNSRNARGIALHSYLHLCTRLALRRADLVLTVSEHARNEIALYSGFDPGRIVPIPHAPTPDLRRVDDPERLAEVRQRHNLARPFVLADALKNPIVIVKAWRLLPPALRERYQMVFFSRRPDPLPVIREAEEAGHARLLIRPSREDLIALYSMAEAFLFPSWIEGFGIPVLEAMTCGAPVIASDRGSIPEVAGDAALLVDANDAEAMARNIELVLTTPAEAERLRKDGLVRAAQFSWRGTAQRILQAYTEAFALSSART
jgi:glycosyltransferase involved in cell wall biosynthesis